MYFYKFDLNKMREHQPPDDGDILHSPEGSNVAAVLGAIERDDPVAFGRIQRYMQAIVPGLEYVSRLEIPTVNRESVETIQFAHQFGDRKNPHIFTAINMSDGTLRALAVLAALLQSGVAPPSAIGIEEPETGLHPAAAGILWDALMDGCERTQVLVTTQSPDLLDRKDVPADAILAVDMDAGKTEIGPIVESSRMLLQEQLATPGELLRQSRLSPKEQLTYPQSYLRF
jgi:predicted ATPase